MNKKKVIVRFPPSPTGLFHVGNARTFLFNYLFAKQNDGQIIFRLEDTDKERSKKEYEDDIIENLKWLGIEPDFSSMIRQSKRGDIYKKYIEKLIAEDKAYFAEERKIGEAAEARPPALEAAGDSGRVIRFRNPNKKIKFNDLVRGDIEFDTTELKDFIIAKSLEEPVYHLAVVVDDFEMKVTHVIRGDDGISNTPRQILIQEAIGASRPTYAHLPMMLAEDKTKLSKRKHGEKVSVSHYRNTGYLPEAVINLLAMVGWNSGTDQEIFSMEELLKIFDITKVQKSGGIFNVEKLDWLNREYILKTNLKKQLSILNSEFAKTKWRNNEKIKDEEFAKKLLKIMLERIHRWGEIGESIKKGDFDYLFEKPELDESKILWKKESKEEGKKHLEKVLEILDKEKEIMEYAEKEGKGDTLWPLRYSLSGREKSPDPFTLINILGIEESTERIQKAIKLLT